VDATDGAEFVKDEVTRGKVWEHVIPTLTFSKSSMLLKKHRIVTTVPGLSV